MFLGALANYFLSLARTMRGQGHDLEPGGQVLITIGILMVLIDIYNFDPHTEAQPEDWHFINYFYLTRTRLQSVLADLVTISYNLGRIRSIILYVKILRLYRRSKKSLSSLSLNVISKLNGVHKHDVLDLFLQWCNIRS